MAFQMRNRREYFRAIQATPKYQEAERARNERRKADPIYREKERLRSQHRRLTDANKLNAQARFRHAARMASDEAYRISKARNAIGWIKRNPSKALANVIRRDAQKLRAMPNWVNRAQIQSIYELARASKKEVDHIVPLRSDYVCGLHVPWNLQLIDSRANKSKGNRHWPDQ